MTSSLPATIGDELDLAHDYACALLADLGETAKPDLRRCPEHPAASWARSGAMALTGRALAPPRICPVPLAACADGALLALGSLTGHKNFAGVKGAALLGERAAVSDYHRNGAISPGGSCRFVRTSDGWVALNLARPEDWQMIPALIEQDIAPDWPALEKAVLQQQAGPLVMRGRELGLAVADHAAACDGNGWYQIRQKVANDPGERGRLPLVVDLSSLWAGPLAGHLLQLAGARVIKVESTERPDGARLGPIDFYDLLNHGKESVALDFAAERGRAQLRALLGRADIVIEASRPRALVQLGVSAEEILTANPRLAWISITGYGRWGDAGQWIAFGDDAAVAAGLSAVFAPEEDAAPIFCGDAIGDPLTGLHAALLAWSAWQSGAGGLYSIALRDIVGHCIAFDRPSSVEETIDREEKWSAFLERERIPVAAPSARRPKGRARPLGADNAGSLPGLGIAC